MLTTFLDYYGSMGYLVPKRVRYILAKNQHALWKSLFLLCEKLYSPKPSKFENHIWKLTYESPKLGQLLDLISLSKTHLLEPRFESYNPYDMAY